MGWCTVCARPYADLPEHMYRHTGAWPYACAWCGQGAVSQATLRVHERTHTRERPFVCDAAGCTRRFSSRSSLLRHRGTHQRRVFGCPCGRTYVRPLGVALHRHQVHGLPLACPLCAEPASDLRALRAHLAAGHVGPAAAVCPTCGDQFASYRGMLEHLAGHLGVRYTCDCGASFTRPRSLRRHRSVTHCGQLAPAPPRRRRGRPALHGARPDVRPTDVRAPMPCPPASLSDALYDMCTE